MTKAKLPYPKGGEWSFEMIDAYHNEIARVAEHYQLDTYENQLMIVTADQMLDAYASVGMPVLYGHWSYGKAHFANDWAYKQGRQGLAYELVINSDPCVSYLMEQNTIMMQALVIAHAAYGHNSFFKGNYLFRQHTRADNVLEYFRFARNYIAEMEEKHGYARVEQLLDAAHSLQRFSVDRYQRPRKTTAKELQRKMEEHDLFLQTNQTPLTARDIIAAERKRAQDIQQDHEEGVIEPEENLLRFLEKEAPNLEKWEREVLHIVRKTGQYFYPQRQTKLMNEGWATFWHYTIINHLFEEGLLENGFMLEFMTSHTGVTMQPGQDHPYYNGINPYSLGFAMYQDIRRIATEPTLEDRQWFPNLVDRPWREVIQEAMINFKDESFVRQYLSPKVIRDFRMLSVLAKAEDEKHLIVDFIHNEEGYRTLRHQLADQYDISTQEPRIEVVKAKMRSDRSLTLRHTYYNGQELDSDQVIETMSYLRKLWGFKVNLAAMKGDDKADAYENWEPDAEGVIFSLNEDD